MNSSYHLIIQTVVFASLVAICLACHGYKLKVNEIKSCTGPNTVITLSDDVSVILDDECNLSAKGCGQGLPFKTAVAKYKATKPPLPPFVGEIDLCEAAEKYSEMLDPAFEMLGLPNRCPLEKEIKYCIDPDKKVNIEPYKSKLSLVAGKLDVQLNITHDTGISCFHVNIEVIKPKKNKS